MTHLALDARDAARTPRTVPPSPAACHPLSRQVLEWQIALRRSRLGELEAEMIAACEAAATAGRVPYVARADRDSWDRAAWHQYLAAAMRLEPHYGPRMRHIRREITQLERLAALDICA